MLRTKKVKKKATTKIFKSKDFVLANTKQYPRISAKKAKINY